MDEIMQGTTPSLTIKIKPADFLLANVARLEIYVQNGGAITTYDESDVSIDTDANTVSLTFTEEETAAFQNRFPVEAQGRFWLQGGGIVGIKKLSFSVADMLGVGD